MRPATALLLALGILACVLACNRSKPAPAAPGGLARLSYLDPHCDPTSQDCRCTGTIEDPAGLKALALDTADLKTGVVCVVGDFDGNGSRDVAIAGKEYDCERSRAAPVRVLMIDHERILRAFTLPEELGCLSPSPLAKGVYPGVLSDRDGLDASVTADGEERIYYWDGTRFASEVAEEGD